MESHFQRNRSCAELSICQGERLFSNLILHDVDYFYSDADPQLQTPHISTPNLKEEELVCSVDPQSGCNMNEIELKWLGKVKPPQADAGSPTISQLLVELKEETARWYELAVHMKIPEWKLAIIKGEEHSLTERLIKALEYWQKNADPSNNPFTWDTVIQALKKMKNNTLADAIAEKCRKNPQAMVS